MCQGDRMILQVTRQPPMDTPQSGYVLLHEQAGTPSDRYRARLG